MKKYQMKWLISGTFAALLVAACQSDDATTAVDQVFEEVTEEGTPQVEALTKEQAIELVSDRYTTIVELFNETGHELNIEDGHVTDEHLDLLSKKFAPYVTADYMANELTAIAKVYCFSGCDGYFLPNDPSYALDVQLEQLSTTKIKLTGFYTADVLTPNAMKETITFHYEDETWKIDQTTRDETILSLTADDALQLLKDYGYDNLQFIEEKLQVIKGGTEQKVYRFDSGGIKIAVAAASGYFEVEIDAPLASTPQTPNASDNLYSFYSEKYDAVEAEIIASNEAFTGYTTVEMNEHEAEILQLWDDLLNDLYRTLKDHLPAPTFEKLREEQRQWILDRDAEAKKTATEEAGDGTMYTMVYLSSLSSQTQERCHELLQNYITQL